MLKALAGPFGHTGVKFIPTGGINAATCRIISPLPQVAAIGGSWMAERKLVTEKAWAKITALTAEAMKVIAQAKNLKPRKAADFCDRDYARRFERAATRALPYLQFPTVTCNGWSRRSAKRFT